MFREFGITMEDHSTSNLETDNSISADQCHGHDASDDSGRNQAKRPKVRQFHEEWRETWLMDYDENCSEMICMLCSSRHRSIKLDTKIVLYRNTSKVCYILRISRLGCGRGLWHPVFCCRHSVAPELSELGHPCVL